MVNIILALAIAFSTTGGQYARAACHPHQRSRHQKWIRLLRDDERSAHAAQPSEVVNEHIPGAGEILDNGGGRSEGQGLSIP
jgi:hypothetical protein